jgi:hypothetical protein
MGNLLFFAVFFQCEVFGGQIGDVPSLAICNSRNNVDQLNIHAQLGVRGTDYKADTYKTREASSHQHLL